MPVIAIEDLPEHLTAGSTVAAIDIGTIDAEALLAALKRDGVAVLVAGLPINMDGSQGPRAQASRAFVSNLRRLTDMPMAFWDERLSTVAAERALIEMDVSRGKRGERIDSAAAAFILQGVLDRLHVMARPT
jgi:putative Holliday junction resolvase